jgi:aryl-alcohol dehydrogenase-like predicted oxidoreductase
MTKVPEVLEQRPLGRAGLRTSILALGTRRLAETGQRNTIRIVRGAIDRGVTVIETGHDYADGRMERWLGLALRDGYRERVTIIWQCGAPMRDYKTSMQQFEESLKRLRSTTFDVWCFQDVIYDNDPDWIYDHGGLDAAQEARDQGRVRLIAFGGYKAPHIHLKLLSRGFAWDAVAMPLNPLDASYRSFERQVLPEVIRRGATVIGTKPLAGGAIPAARVVRTEEALRYCFSLPISTVICGMRDAASLRKGIKVAATFKPFHAGEMDALRQRARQAAGDGRFERYKTTTEFDGRPGLVAHGYARK